MTLCFTFYIGMHFHEMPNTFAFDQFPCRFDRGVTQSMYCPTSFTRTNRLGLHVLMSERTELLLIEIFSQSRLVMGVS